MNDDANDFDILKLHSTCLRRNSGVYEEFFRLKSSDNLTKFCDTKKKTYLFFLFPHTSSLVDSENGRGLDRSLIIFWKNMGKSAEIDTVELLKETVIKYYKSYLGEINFIDVFTPKEINKLSRQLSSRNNSERVVIHYVDYGIPMFKKSDMLVFNLNDDTYKKYPFSEILKESRVQTLLIFDCSISDELLKILESNTSKAKSKSYFVCATSAKETIPSNIHIPRDILTCCIFTPVRIAVKCHIVRYYHNLINGLCDTEDDSLLNTVLDRHGDSLSKILQVIIDSIAYESLSHNLYYDLFKSDELMCKVFRGFLLAQYLLKPFQVNPYSNQRLPDLSYHPLWNHWKSILDDAVYRTDPNDYMLDLFTRTSSALGQFIKRKNYDIPMHFFSILLNMDNIGNNKEVIYNLSYIASISEEKRKVMANVYIIRPLFSLLETELTCPFFHSLIYLILSLIGTEASLCSFLENEVVFERLSNKLIQEDTQDFAKPYIAAVICNLQQVFECNHLIEQVVNVSMLNKTSDPLLVLWLLLILRRANCIVSEDDYVNIACMTHHDSYEVRAAALVILQNLKFTDNFKLFIHVFAITLFCRFDCSFTVRFNYLLFIKNLLHYDGNEKARPLELTECFTFSLMIKEWINFVTSKSISFSISEFKTEDVIDVMNNFLEIGESASSEILYEYSFSVIRSFESDPNKCIRDTAKECLTNLTREKDGYQSLLKCSTDKLINSISLQDRVKGIFRTANTQADQPEDKYDIENIRLVAEYETQNQGPTCIYYYDDKSISIGYSKGHLIHKDAHGTVTSFDLNGTVSSVCLIDNLIVSATNNGSLYLIDKGISKLVGSFRSEYSNTKYSQYIESLPQTSKLVSISSGSDVIKLWDINKEMCILEYSISNSSSGATALSLDTNNYNNGVIVGLSDGSLAQIDFRDIVNVSMSSSQNLGSIMNIKYSKGLSQCMYASTTDGNIFKWNNFDEITHFRDYDRELKWFDTHVVHNVFLFNKNKLTYITDSVRKDPVKLSSKIVHASFHPKLPCIAAVEKDGRILEYEFYS